MRQKTDWQKLGLAIVLLALLIWGGNYLVNQGKSKQTQQGAEQVKTISYVGVEGKTALELLTAEYQVDYQTSEFGAFVNEIDGVKNSSDTFWTFYVNGNLAEVSADKYVTKAGDIIEWKYEKSPF